MVSANLNNSPQTKIGIIAGRGDLPLRLAKSLTNRDIPIYVLLVENEADPADYAEFPHEIIVITKVGKFLKTLRREKCQRVTMAGPINRPNFKNIFPDKEGFKLLSKIGASLSRGDDGLLRAITRFVEDNGFQVVGAHELDDDFIAQCGTLGTVIPDEEDLTDIEKGIKIVRAIGAMDIGQAIVIRQGYVLGVEAAEGTAKLIERCKDFAWDNPAGILVKLPKPGQELRTDMPTIGSETVAQAQSAGLKGIVIEAGNSLILGLNEVVELADKAKIFIHAIKPESNSHGEN